MVTWWPSACAGDRGRGGVPAGQAATRPRACARVREGRPAVLRQVPGVQAPALPPLLRLRPVHPQDGSLLLPRRWLAVNCELTLLSPSSALRTITVRSQLVNVAPLMCSSLTCVCVRVRLCVCVCGVVCGVSYATQAHVRFPLARRCSTSLAEDLVLGRGGQLRGPGQP